VKNRCIFPQVDLIEEWTNEGVPVGPIGGKDWLLFTSEGVPGPLTYFHNPSLKGKTIH
jgi:hypothetical protein